MFAVFFSKDARTKTNNLVLLQVNEVRSFYPFVYFAAKDIDDILSEGRPPPE